MGLVISLAKGAIFNIGYRRFVVESVLPVRTCIIRELGGESFEITPDEAVSIGTATLREGIRNGSGTTRLDIHCDRTVPIWRGVYDSNADAALLAPVPLEHLESALAVQEASGRVAFGSSAWETFVNLDKATIGQPCQCYIYASSRTPSATPQVTWTATYLRQVESRSGAHPSAMKYRPQSTAKYPADNFGHWAIFWEVTDLRKLEKSEYIPIGSLRGLGKSQNYKKIFRPEGPLIIEPVL